MAEDETGDLYQHASVTCPVCTRSWEAIFPIEAFELECPDCGRITGIQKLTGQEEQRPTSHPQMPSTIAYGQRCAYDDCPLEASCTWCGGVCLLHCAGRTSWWRSLRYFWRAWRAYMKTKWSGAARP